MTTIPNCTLPELCRWAESWLPTLVPADVRGPVYVLNATLPDGMDACVGRETDLAYRAEIGPRWCGRGPTILTDLTKFRLNEKRLREVNHANDADVAMLHGCLARRLLRMLLHETAHVVLWEPVKLATHATTCQTRHVIDAAIWRPPAEPDHRLPAPFADHGADFARAALHLHYRAKRQGVTLPLHGLAADFQYSMAPIERYRAALGNECWRLRDASFRDISKTTPPRKFVELWVSDVSTWLRTCAKYGGLTDEIITAGYWSMLNLTGCLITRDKIAAIVAA